MALKTSALGCVENDERCLLENGIDIRTIQELMVLFQALNARAGLAFVSWSIDMGSATALCCQADLALRSLEDRPVAEGAQ
jgi:hypothetical protein